MHMAIDLPSITGIEAHDEGSWQVPFPLLAQFAEFVVEPERIGSSIIFPLIMSLSPPHSLPHILTVCIAKVHVHVHIFIDIAPYFS